MSFSNSLETSLLGLLFNASAIANVADNAASAPITAVYLSLHTGDPGEAGNQTSSEADYTSYARASTNRSSGAGGWTVSGGAASLASNVDFATSTGAGTTNTHFGAGTASSGTGVLWGSGSISPTIPVGASGITPRLTTSTQVTLD